MEKKGDEKNIMREKEDSRVGSSEKEGGVIIIYYFYFLSLCLKVSERKEGW